MVFIPLFDLFIAAMVVRFITRRFIGEYDPNFEKVYTFSTIIDDEMVLFEILDAAGQLNVSSFARVSLRACFRSLLSQESIY